MAEFVIVGDHLIWHLCQRQQKHGGQPSAIFAGVTMKQHATLGDIRDGLHDRLHFGLKLVEHIVVAAPVRVIHLSNLPFAHASAQKGQMMHRKWHMSRNVAGCHAQLFGATQINDGTHTMIINRLCTIVV